MMPYLEPYKGRDSRHTCPACKNERTFKYYINAETGLPINKAVGRCDREIKCGYHYTPREYYRDNPELNSFAKKRKRTQSVVSGDLFEQGIQINQTKQSFENNKFNENNQTNQSNQFNLSGNINYVEILQQKTDCISPRYVISSKSYNSNFVEFLHNYFPVEKIKEAVDNYALGAASYKRVIFWQIDNNDNVRTGKIMQYNPHTGKRVKNEKGGINWVHNIIKKRSAVFEHYNLCQCYFGEHLLNLYPDKPVAMVEAEKTAVIGSIHCPDFIWLAAGNLNGLTVPKSKVLHHRDVILFPDAGCYDKWADKMKRISREVHCTMEVSDVVEKHATEQQLVDGYDFADYVIEKLNGGCEQERSKPDAYEPADHNSISHELSSNEKKEPSSVLQNMLDKNPSLTTLIDRFGLEEVLL
ncbi:MAG: DUF6371 domain-containing protein [Fermentimonas sp.]|nr:DUF6371 domain-containing protein [Fermentimonas sp.]